MKKKNILITGASGSVGFEVFKELNSRKENFNIRVFSRNSKPDLSYEVNVEGTKRILKAIQASKINPLFIYTSSIAVYGDRLDNPLIKITDEVKPNDIYAETKLKAEELIKDSKIDYLIFRLSYCFSIRSFKIDPLLFRVPLATSFEIIDARDVALAMANAIEYNHLVNKTFILAGGKDCRITYKKHLNNMFEIIGLGRNLLPEEAFAKGGFNCGFCRTEKLNEKLNYQHHNLKDFYKEIEDWIGYKKYFASIFKWIIRKYLLSKSKYYKN
ncbi:MAG: SDR family oxidoreductase [Candidatus Lokiarchaeota archaeon]